MSAAIEYLKDGIVQRSNLSKADLYAAYVEKNGWALVPIPHGSKGPRQRDWNKRENCITTPEQARAISGNVGIAHAFCTPATCVLDIDRLDEARIFLRERGIDIDALRNAPNAVAITSGQPNRAKLLYMPPEALPSLTLAGGAFELRCATKDGLTVQDVLPPSVHPSGQTYQWALGTEAKGTRPPPLPDNLLALWRDALAPSVERAVPQANPNSSVPLNQLRDVLCGHDPDAGYDEWIRVGMALHFETRGASDGLTLWDEWSARGEKYKGRTDLEPHWRSFRLDTSKPITLGSLRYKTVARPEDFSQAVTGIAANANDGTRSVVQLRGGELHKQADQCEALLRDEIYVRERSLVRIGGTRDLTTACADTAVRDNTQAVIIPASTEYLRRRLSELARFEAYRRREKEWVQVDCPRDLPTNIAGQGDWPRLRKLEAIARAPFVRADGTVCEAPGYDSESCVFLAPNASFPAVPRNPSRADARAALKSLLAPFDQFPFGNEESRAAFIANIITEVARTAIDTSPAFFYTAPTPGTGKTLLSEMPSRIVHGCGPSMRPWAEAIDELRKNLFASLLAGDRTIGYDNVPSGVKVRSPILCGFLTADVYSDRKLGVSEVPALPNRSVVFLTGNNVTPAGDLARRSIVVRLDANTERLSERRFRVHDLRGHIADHRQQLLIAALTIISAYFSAGQPVQAVPLPSFERWSKMARDPLLWLDMTDPVATQAHETDDETAPLAKAFALIHASPAVSARGFTASELASTCGAFVGDGSLSAALEAAGCGSPHDAKHVGYWLRDKRDRIAQGLKLERLSAPEGTTKWRVRTITG